MEILVFPINYKNGFDLHKYSDTFNLAASSVSLLTFVVENVLLPEKLISLPQL